MPSAALPPQLILEEADLGTAAPWADNAVLPLGTAGHEVVKAILWTREVKDCFLEGLGFVEGFHILSIPQIAGLVNYIITLNWTRNEPDPSPA
jgi:hypothetical protein